MCSPKNMSTLFANKPLCPMVLLKYYIAFHEKCPLQDSIRETLMAKAKERKKNDQKETEPRKIGQIAREICPKIAKSAT